MYSLVSKWQYVIIGSDNGSAPNRRQAIIWTNGGLVNWRIYASLSLNEFSGYNGICMLRNMINVLYKSLLSQQSCWLTGTRHL